MTRYRYWLCCCVQIVMVILITPSISAQNIVTDMDHDERHLFDRMIILTNGGPHHMHSSIFPYLRSDLVTLADTFAKRGLSAIDAHLVQSIWDQNNEFVMPDTSVSVSGIEYIDSTRTFHYLREGSEIQRYRKSKHPLFNTFYRTPAYLYEVDIKDFYLRVNPILHVGAGKETNEDVTTFINQRGLSIRGGIGHNVYFHTSLYDSQIRFPNYVNRFTDETGVVPGAGLYKNYESIIFKFTQGRDFLLANAYVGLDLGKYFGIQLGHHQHFIGDGIRSLFLSDFSTPFFSLKINTRIWKFHYQNIFAELSADNFSSAFTNGMPIPKKYMAAHYLSFKPANNITLGLFETVIFDREGHQFELQYLNPVILFRTVEGSIGSPDNVMLGLNARWNIRRAFSLYGQFVLDDILIGEILDGRLGWWGNKFGHQLGAKYINAGGIDNLDLQVEWNQVRPYTYSHYDDHGNYSHYKQALAHPLGANFNEWITSLRYQVTPRIRLHSSLHIITKGEDFLDSISFGGNILIPNTLRGGDFDHTIGQGVNTDIVFWNSTVQYEVSPGLFLDVQYLYRNQKSEIAERALKTNLFQVGIRLNAARREDVF